VRACTQCRAEETGPIVAGRHCLKPREKALTDVLAGELMPCSARCPLIRPTMLIRKRIVPSNEQTSSLQNRSMQHKKKRKVARIGMTRRKTSEPHHGYFEYASGRRNRPCWKSAFKANDRLGVSSRRRVILQNRIRMVLIASITSTLLADKTV
jgi:hypothetical protein